MAPLISAMSRRSMPLLQMTHEQKESLLILSLMYATHQTEPQTNGKVVLNTTLGPLDIELWPKEAPKATRNFVQLCLDGFFDRCDFFRVIPSFIVQTGDPSNTGTGPARTYLPNDALFPNELHSRLHFSHRGIVACAGTPNDPSMNANQFFITLDKAPELEKKHTIFGKVVGNSIFNLLNVNEMEMAPGFEDKLAEPPHIISASVVWNPYEDVFPRESRMQQQEQEAGTTTEKPKTAARAIKNFGLLSFGDEAQQDEAVFSLPREKVTIAPSRTKSKPNTRPKFDDEEQEAFESSKVESAPKLAANDDNEWETQVKRKAKEWNRAEKKAERREAKLEERKREKTRMLAGKTESDSDEASFDEEGNPTYRTRKEGQVEDIDAPKFKKKKLSEVESDDQHRLRESIPPRAVPEHHASVMMQKPKKTSVPNEDNILAKLAAFKSKIGKPSSGGPKSEEDDWKQAKLVFDPALEREGEDVRDMQRDDYVVYDPSEMRDAKPIPSPSYDSRYGRNRRDERYDQYERVSSSPSRGMSSRRSPIRKRADSEYSRYDSSPPRHYEDSRPNYDRRRDASPHSYRSRGHEEAERTGERFRERRDSRASPPRRRPSTPLDKRY